MVEIHNLEQPMQQTPNKDRRSSVHFVVKMVILLLCARKHRFTPGYKFKNQRGANMVIEDSIDADTFHDFQSQEQLDHEPRFGFTAKQYRNGLVAFR